MLEINLINLFLLLLVMLVVTFFNSSLIVGAYIAANDKDSEGRGLILYKLNMWIVSKLGTYYSKPFFYCYKCMPSLWGGLPLVVSMYVGGSYALSQGLSIPFWYWPLPLVFGPLYAGVLACTSTLLYNMVTYFGKNKAKEYFKAQADFLNR